jgi:hypothetical protein
MTALWTVVGILAVTQIATLLWVFTLDHNWKLMDRYLQGIGVKDHKPYQHPMALEPGRFA